jgi:hypothetical protein
VDSVAMITVAISSAVCSMYLHIMRILPGQAACFRNFQVAYIPVLLHWDGMHGRKTRKACLPE